VGANGLVVAADIDPKFLGDLDTANVQIRRCDINNDELEPNFYDLVHCRLLLMHMSDPAAVLRRMVATLRPGGWLLAEEPDSPWILSIRWLTYSTSSFRKRIEFLASAGMVDMCYGRVLPIDVEALGLAEARRAYEDPTFTYRGCSCIQSGVASRRN
jgi:SAM-dependent methyltransferase